MLRTTRPTKLSKQDRALLARIRPRQRQLNVACVTIAEAKVLVLHPRRGLIGAYASLEDARTIESEWPGSYCVAARGFQLARVR